MAIRVIPVQTAREKAQFMSLPQKLHRYSAEWEKSKLSVDNTLFDTEHNPFLSESTIKRFMAISDGKIVGRIAGIVDQNYINHCGKAVGLFAFFDSIDNTLVSTALFNTASQWLRDHEMVKISGPVYPSPHLLDGLLVEGFSYDPYHNAPWHPKYYANLFEASGFQKAKDFQSWRISDEVMDNSDRLTDNNTAEKDSFNIESYNIYNKKNSNPLPDNFWDEFNLLNSSHTGERKLSHDELDYLRKLYRIQLSPCQVTIAKVSDKLVGIAIIIPDLYDAHILAARKIFPVGTVIFQWNRRKYRNARIAFLQVDKGHVGKGLKRKLVIAAIKNAISNDLKVTEISYIKEDDVQLNKLLKDSNYNKYKTFRIYQRPLR